MASFEAPKFKAPKHAFDSEDLAVLDEAFAAAWTTIRPYYSSQVPDADEEIKIELRRLLLYFAARGITDASTLRNLVLSTLPMSGVDPTRRQSRLMPRCPRTAMEN